MRLSDGGAARELAINTALPTDFSFDHDRTTKSTHLQENNALLPSLMRKYPHPRGERQDLAPMRCP